MLRRLLACEGRRDCFSSDRLATVSPPTASPPPASRPTPTATAAGGPGCTRGRWPVSPQRAVNRQQGWLLVQGNGGAGSDIQDGGRSECGWRIQWRGHRAKVHSVRGTAAPPTPPTGGDRVGRGRWGEGGQGKEKDESEQRVCVCGHRFGVSLGGWNVSKNAVSKDHAEQTIRTRLEPAKDKRKIFVWMVRTIPPSW